LTVLVELQHPLEEKDLEKLNQIHRHDSQLIVFPLLSQNGVYIIEDTHTNYSPEHQESFLGIGLYDYFKGLSERLNIDFINSHFRKERYKLPRHERSLINQIPDIVRDIFSIEFFDSVIAIKKRTKIEPLRIRK
jgi:hypothetical protein